MGRIWFVNLGSDTPDKGPYDVKPPANTAQDQVRFLSQILARSAKARKELQPAVISIRDCARGSGPYTSEIAVIDSVTKNRKDLIAALSTAPVDKVPDGTQLVNELITALRYSLKADEAYASWARQVDREGCGAGSEAAGVAYSKKAGTAKVTFANHWNSLIVPRYGVARITREKL